MGPYLQVSVVDTPAMAIINSIYKLLEIPTCFIFTHPSMIYLHNKKVIRAYTAFCAHSTKIQYQQKMMMMMIEETNKALDS